MSAPCVLGLATTARVAVGLAGLTAATAVAVRLGAADEARALLDFRFPGLRRRLGASLDIFANNLRVLAALLAACGVAQLAHRAADGWERSLYRLATAVCDAAVLLCCLLHIALVGAAIGAYGRRTVETVLAHGPFELVAFSLALALYLVARRELLPVRRLVAPALVAAVALAIGAVLEVYA